MLTGGRKTVAAGYARRAARRPSVRGKRQTGLRINARRRRRYWQDPEGARARRRRWRRANLEAARAAGRRHYAANRGRVLAYHAKYRRRNRHKIDAQIVVKAGIITGDLVRGPCEVCGAHPSQRRIHAHHEDYGHPLEVRWLCVAHHNQLHAGMLCLLPAAATRRKMLG